MLLGTKPKLAELIIHCFRLQSCLNVNQIYEHIQKVKKVTKRAIFQELNSLISQGVLIRLKGLYTVKSTWIIEILQLGHDLQQKQLCEENVLLHLPQKDEKVVWKIQSMKKLDAFWEHIIFILYKISPTKKMYVWCPHYWFHLIHFKKELQIFRSMHHGKNKRYYIIGGETFIDKMPTQFWNKKCYQWVHAPRGFKGDTDSCFCVIDDYVMTGKFTKLYSRQVHEFCTEVKKITDIQDKKLNQLIESKSMIKVTLEHNRLKADKLRNLFFPYFTEYFVK